MVDYELREHEKLLTQRVGRMHLWKKPAYWTISCWPFQYQCCLTAQVFYCSWPCSSSSREFLDSQVESSYKWEILICIVGTIIFFLGVINHIGHVGIIISVNGTPIFVSLFLLKRFTSISANVTFGLAHVINHIGRWLIRLAALVLERPATNCSVSRFFSQITNAFFQLSEWVASHALLVHNQPSPNI